MLIARDSVAIIQNAPSQRKVPSMACDWGSGGYLGNVLLGEGSIHIVINGGQPADIVLGQSPRTARHHGSPACLSVPINCYHIGPRELFFCLPRLTVEFGLGSRANLLGKEKSGHSVQGVETSRLHMRPREFKSLLGLQGFKFRLSRMRHLFLKG